MSKLNFGYGINISRKVIYLSLLAMGIYFIYQGGVVTKFLQKKTSFSENDEPVTEAPTILTGIYYDKLVSNWTFGKDFNITFQPPGSALPYSLKLGKNVIEHQSQILYFDEVRNGPPNFFRITPQNFSPEMDLSFELQWNLKNVSTILSKVAITTTLSTENNSVICVLQNSLNCSSSAVYNDGDVKEVPLHPGELGLYNVYPRKYVYLQDLEPCRLEPFNELILKNVMFIIFDECSRPCRPKINFGTRLNKVVEQLPICDNEDDLECYEKVAVSVGKENITTKPCTKLQYGVDGATYSFMNANQVKFDMKFSTKFVTVKEEYLIYDAVAMISAIGGTMGLCIGFSFTEVANFLLRSLENGLKRFETNLAKVEDDGDRLKAGTTMAEDVVKRYLQKHNFELESRLAAIEKTIQEKQ